MRLFTRALTSYPTVISGSNSGVIFTRSSLRRLTPYPTRFASLLLLLSPSQSFHDKNYNIKRLNCQ